MVKRMKITYFIFFRPLPNQIPASLFILIMESISNTPIHMYSMLEGWLVRARNSFVFSFFISFESEVQGREGVNKSFLRKKTCIFSGTGVDPPPLRGRVRKECHFFIHVLPYRRHMKINEMYSSDSVSDRRTFCYLVYKIILFYSETLTLEGGQEF